MNVLAVGAHPDDVELGCGGALVQHVAGGDRVTVLVMTTGQRGVYHGQSRAGEQERASALLAADLRWAGFEDGAVPSGAEGITVIDCLVAETGAQLVYTHAPDDSHQDHRATSIASLAAARRVPTVLYYETPSTQAFQPTVFVDIDASLDAKLRLLRMHLSQVLRDGPVDLSAITAQARFRGSQTRVRHAEAFVPARFVWDVAASGGTADPFAVADGRWCPPARISEADSGLLVR